MKQNLTIEVIINPHFNHPSSPGKTPNTTEQKWLSVIMLFILNKPEAVFETMYLDSIGEMTDYCLS